MNLFEALRKVERAKIAFVGSGGKTTTIFQLARALKPPVVVTCSTHMGAWQAGAADRHIVLEHAGQLEQHVGQIEGVTLFTGPSGSDHRLKGVDEGSLSELSALSDRLGFSLLIEADGSRQLPLKAPALHEPVIPGWVDKVIVVAGLSGLGKPLNQDHVHRPELFSALSGLPMESVVNEAGLARVLAHREGGLKGIPAKAERILILNQAEHDEIKNAALRIANQVRDGYDSVIIGSLIEQKVWKVVESTAGIVLAGGGARRFGQPKLLLPWKDDEVIIRHIVKTALAAHLNPVIVVTGALNEEIRQSLTGLPVTFCENLNWQAGQSTSIRRGLQATPAQVGSALFLLADQPQITIDLIMALVDQHQRTLAPVTAPHVQGQRANPVLFDRVTFPVLVALQGDTGGRAIFNQYPPQFLDWDDARILLDIDTPDDYERLKAME